MEQNRGWLNQHSCQAAEHHTLEKEPLMDNRFEVTVAAGTRWLTPALPPASRTGGPRTASRWKPISPAGICFISRQRAASRASWSRVAHDRADMIREGHYAKPIQRITK
jgi:hypothetical protein